MTSADDLRASAREWLAAAEDEREANRYNVAFEAARHAAELAAKAILYESTGSYPDRKHDVSGPLAQNNLVPQGVRASDLSKLLSEFTLGTYGFGRTVHKKDVNQAIRLARRMVDAL